MVFPWLFPQTIPCCPKRHHGDSPSAHKRHVYRSCPVLPQHGEDPGPDHYLHFNHSHTSQERLEELMLDTTQLVKDVGTLLEGPEAVKEGLIDEVGGMKEALGKLNMN